jgi:hypothetical protein
MTGWNWFWLQASPATGEKEVKPQQASQAPQTSFEGAPPTFLGSETPKPRKPLEGN